MMYCWMSTDAILIKEKYILDRLVVSTGTSAEKKWSCRQEQVIFGNGMPTVLCVSCLACRIQYKVEKVHGFFFIFYPAEQCWRHQTCKITRVIDFPLATSAKHYYLGLQFPSCTAAPRGVLECFQLPEVTADYSWLVVQVIEWINILKEQKRLTNV